MITEKNNMSLDRLVALPTDSYLHIFNFIPVENIFSMVNTCTALRNYLIFPSTCYIIEHNHNYAPNCIDNDLKATAEEMSRRLAFTICPSNTNSADGKFYTINIAEFIKKPVGGCYFEEWEMKKLEALVRFNGTSAIFILADNTLSICNLYRKEKFGEGGKTLMRANPIIDFLLDTPCYQKVIQEVDETETTEEELERTIASYWPASKNNDMSKLSSSSTEDKVIQEVDETETTEEELERAIASYWPASKNNDMPKLSSSSTEDSFLMR